MYNTDFVYGVQSQIEFDTNKEILGKMDILVISAEVRKIWTLLNFCNPVFYYKLDLTMLILFCNCQT